MHSSILPHMPNQDRTATTCRRVKQGSKNYSKFVYNGKWKVERAAKDDGIMASVAIQLTVPAATHLQLTWWCSKKSNL